MVGLSSRARHRVGQGIEEIAAGRSSGNVIMLHTYRRKAETELGAACAVPAAELPPEELAAERDEWVAIFERMLLMVRLAPPLRERHGD